MAGNDHEQLRSEVSVGEGIAFEFRTGSEGSVITSITKE
jgi:Cu(I)/Ag(I) efflux system protein CusF